MWVYYWSFTFSALYLVVAAVDPFPLVIAAGSVLMIVSDLLRQKEVSPSVDALYPEKNDNSIVVSKVKCGESKRLEPEKKATFPLSDEEIERKKRLDEYRREFVHCKPRLPLVCSNTVKCRLHFPDRYDEEYAEFHLSTKRLISFLKSIDRPNIYDNQDKVLNWLEGFDEKNDAVTDVSVIDVGNGWGGSMFDVLLNQWKKKKLQMRCRKCEKGYSFGKIKVHEIDEGHIMEEIKCPKGHVLRYHMIEHVF